MEEELDFEGFEQERLVKSTQRVRDLGEVFTPSNIVDNMLDLLPEEIWQIHPSRTFLEPSVGNGNFVSAILSRKLALIDEAMSNGLLPAGKTLEAAQFHALEALSSIYGVDISEDNIIGGTPAHEIACRPRLLTLMKRWCERYLGDTSVIPSEFLKSAKWIANHNMIIGNMLDFDAYGDRVDRSKILLSEYKWSPQSRWVQIFSTTMDDVIQSEKEGSDGTFALFGPEAPSLLWEGPAQNLHQARNYAILTLEGQAVTNTKVRP